MVILWILKLTFFFLVIPEFAIANSVDLRLLSRRQVPTLRLRRSKLLRQRRTISDLNVVRKDTLSTIPDANGTAMPSFTIPYSFDQLIDHANPTLGVFTQRFWQNWEFYQPGGPIFLTTPGESNAELNNFIELTNRTIEGTFAQNLNGAVVMLEHRFFGESLPSFDFTEANLAVHTISQAIEDLVYFAQNVVLAMPGGDTEAIRPHKTPWILVGGSYSGALTIWTLNKEPGVFWAGYSSSGVVQPIADFWQYFEPIRQYMPRNCSADVEQVVNYVDNIVASGNITAIDELENFFEFRFDGLVDFFNFMMTPMHQWQKLDIVSSNGSFFYEFCDKLEIKFGQVAAESGWGLQNALESWRDYFHNSSLLAEWTIPATSTESEVQSLQPDDLSWQWMVCNEVGWIQIGPPENYTGPAIAFRELTMVDNEDICLDLFPGAFKSNTIADRVAATAATYLGWNTPADRIFIANGKRDPWLYATFSAPTQSISSTDLRPIFLGDGFHCSDMLMINGIDNSVFEIQQTAISTMKTWVSEFTPRPSPVATTPIATISTSSTSPTPSHSGNASRLKIHGYSLITTWVIALGLAVTGC